MFACWRDDNEKMLVLVEYMASLKEKNWQRFSLYLIKKQEHWKTRLGVQCRHIDLALLVKEYQIGWLWQTKAAHWATSSEIWWKKEEYKMQNQNKNEISAAKSVMDISACGWSINLKFWI